MLSVRRKPKPTLVAIATGGIFAFIGSTIGALWLAAMWGFEIPLNPILLVSHPHVQVFGFTYTFIMGVSYSLVPRFKNRTLEPTYIPYLTLTLVITGLSLLPISKLLGYVILAFAGILHMTLLIKLIGKPKGNLGVSDYFFLASAIILPISFAIKLLQDLQGRAGVDINILQLTLLGFPALTIFGVELRTIHFRGAQLRKTAGFSVLTFFIAAIVLTSISSLIEINSLSIISSILFLAGAIIFIWSIEVFENPLAPVMNRMNDVDRIRYRYFTICIRLAFLWLLAGMIAMLLLSLPIGQSGYLTFILRDTFIHSLGIGFFACTIVGYAPILLPTLISGRIARRGLSLWPLYLLNIGNVFRTLGIILLGIGLRYLWPATLAGPIILLSMLLFMVNFHIVIRKSGKEEALVQIK